MTRFLLKLNEAFLIDSIKRRSNVAIGFQYLNEPKEHQREQRALCENRHEKQYQKDDVYSGDLNLFYPLLSLAPRI